MAFLAEPSTDYEQSFREALAEIPEPEENGFMWPRTNSLEKGFDAYIRHLLRQKDPAYLRPGLVPQSVYWLVEGSEFLGVLKLRHALNDDLRRHGGNIGYGIRPSQRRKGYGRTILRLAMEEARKLGLERLLLTCNARNLASRRVILANGGIFDDEIVERADGRRIVVQRFWIELPTPNETGNLR